MRVALGVAALAFLAAQQTPQPSAKPPVFRAGTRLVQLNVVVHDRHGEPVTDLKKEDFAVLERGKPQAIAFFSMDTAAQAPLPSAPLPAHIFTNVLPEHGGVPTGVTVIVLDLVNTGWADQHRARDALVKFLKQIEPQDRIAIFSLGGRGLTLLHDYTTDSAALVARLHGMTPEISTELDASILNPGEQQELRNMGLDAIADANQREADFYTTNRAVNTLASFEAIAQHLAGLPGRKNLIWLSAGFPLMIGFDEMPEPGQHFSTRDQRIFSPEMESAARALNNSGIAVYPVDARGLVAPTQFSASSRTPGRMPTLAQTNANTDTMRDLAERTGGRASYNTNDLTRAIRRAIDDSRVTYTLGYYSTDESQDGRFRDIKVTVDRPHLDVRTRKGYFAMRPADQAADSRKRDIRAAVWSPLESTALPMNVRVDFIDNPPNTINVFVEVSGRSVSFRKDGDRWKAQLDMIYVQKDDNGKVQGSGDVENLSLALTEENYRKASEQGIIHQHRSPRQSSATTLRIVVRDAASGSVGSVTVPFSKVPG